MTDPTRLDRMISWFSPQRGAERLRARVMIETLAGYEGARVGRRTEGWTTPSATGADAAGELDWARLRDRSRDLVRNSPHAARAIEVKVSHTIGTGITAEVKNRRLADEWARFVDTCDLEGQYDLNGLLAQIERCRAESGECLIRFFRSGRMDRGESRVQLQVLEPEYLDVSRDTSGLEGGGEIKHGIEFDDVGRVVAYWLYPEHPGDRSTMSRVAGRGLVSERVSAEDVIHVFRKLRPDQTRGVTDFAPVILRMRDLDDYDDAEIMRKKIEACLVGIVTTPESLSTTGLGPQTEGEDFTNERMRPATWYRAKPGESVTFNEPKAVQGYSEYKKANQHDVAAGLGIPYELLTGDLTDVNYTSMRGGLIDFRKRVEADQWLLYIPRVCRVIEAKFRSDMKRLAPGVGDRSRFEWTPPKFELMDPLKETQADLEAVLAGFKPLSEVQNASGWSMDDMLDEYENVFRELDKRGLGSILKSDPRTQVQSRRESETPVEPAA